MKKLASTSEAANIPVRYAETQSLSMKEDGEPLRETSSVGGSNAVDANAPSAPPAEMCTRDLAAVRRSTMFGTFRPRFAMAEVSALSKRVCLNDLARLHR